MQKELAIFQSHGYTYEERLSHLLEIDDNKLIIFIESKRWLT